MRDGRMGVALRESTWATDSLRSMSFGPWARLADRKLFPDDGKEGSVEWVGVQDLGSESSGIPSGCLRPWGVLAPRELDRSARSDRCVAAVPWLISERLDLYHSQSVLWYRSRRRGGVGRQAASPIEPLGYGGGQERELRPGTLPVPLIAGFGLAAELALKESRSRRKACQAIREKLLGVLEPLGAIINGDPTCCQAHVVNLSIPGVNSEAAMLALKGVLAISNGSACTSQSYEPSHVLAAMGLDEDRINGALRFSWCHMTEEPDWTAVADRLKGLL